MIQMVLLFLTVIFTNYIQSLWGQPRKFKIHCILSPCKPPRRSSASNHWSRGCAVYVSLVLTTYKKRLKCMTFKIFLLLQHFDLNQIHIIVFYLICQIPCIFLVLAYSNFLAHTNLAWSQPFCWITASWLSQIQSFLVPQ